MPHASGCVCRPMAEIMIEEITQRQSQDPQTSQVRP